MALILKNILDTIICSKKSWKTDLLYNWNDIIGTLANKVHIEKIDEESITLGVFHSSWMQELYLLSPLIIKTINKRLEHPYIKQIRFKHITIKKNVTKKIKNKMVLKKDVQLSKQDERALAHITDPILRDALKAFRMRCYRES